MLIRSSLRWKNCTRTEALVQFFPARKSNELTQQQDMFYYIFCLLVFSWLQMILYLLPCNVLEMTCVNLRTPKNVDITPDIK